ncbi:MAG: YbhB/YbcL family Raf kinase inhibitor-like protein [Anaerolineae bacterium]
MKVTRLFLLALLVLAVACQPAVQPSATTVPTDGSVTYIPGPAPSATPVPSPAATATQTPVPATATPLPPLALSSPSLAVEGDIPLVNAQVPFSVPNRNGSFICPGDAAGKENASPPLEWANVPLEAKSLVLIMVDDLHYAYPDMPEGAMFVHWLVYNIPPTASGLPEGATSQANPVDGALQGVNNYPEPYKQGYGGPCPGVGEKHLYIFTLYALDTTLDLEAGEAYKDVLAAMEGHILAQAELRTYYTGK